MMNALGLQQYLHEHIPISEAMGITVVAASIDVVELHAALAPNLNHRSTAFGGSVASLAVLAGWSLLRIGLDHITPTPQIVIQRSTVEYTAPIAADFDAICRRPADEIWQRFVRALARRGRGRLGIGVAVRCGGGEVGRFEGEFVAFGDVKRVS